MKRRITALMITLCMVLTMMPLHVHATEAGHVHYGGTATCKWKATCEGCGSIYGETDPNNHNDYFGEDNGDGRTHTAMCTCGHIYNASEPHDFSGWEEDGPGQEARFCYECYYTETRSTHTHSYSVATCTTPATCSCNATQGGVDKNNHVGGTEIRGQVEAGEFTEGYTGDTYCLGCGDKISSGSTIPATHVHSWEWTYDSGMHWQKCDCGASSTAAQAHQFDDDSDATCDTCGYTRTIEPAHTHSYSAATCTTPATCSDPTCGETMGDVDKSNHVGGTEIRNAKDATEFESGYTGDTYCLGCGDKLADGETIPATHVHSYAAATCTTPATCSCKATQGDVDKNNHVGGTEIRGQVEAGEFTDGYTGDTYCLGCGDLLSEGKTIPATHTHSYSTEYNDTHHWQECSCGDKVGEAEHTGSYSCDHCEYHKHLWSSWKSSDNNTHTRSCIGGCDQTETVDCTPYWNADDEMHQQQCVEFGCKRTFSKAEKHVYDGDTCTVCRYVRNHTHNYYYYKFDGTNHWKMCDCGQGQTGSVEAHALVDERNNNGHWQECTVCNYYSDAQAHVYSDDSDESCNDCGYSRHVHSFSTATCAAPATCPCGREFGFTEPNNHTGGTEIRNAVKETIVAEGYTGDTYCLGCGSMIASGEVIPKAGVIFDGPGVEDVTFIPAEGTELPGDAEIIVNPHTPSADNLAYVLGIDADTEYLDADNVKIQIVGGEDYTAPDGTEYRMHEIIIINGEEYLITNYMGVGDVLVLMRLSDGATGNYNVAVNKLDFTGSMNGTVQEYAYDKINIGGITYDVRLSYNSDAGRVVVLYYNGSPAGKMYINESRSSYFREGFDPETLKAQQNVNDLGTVTPGENPIDGLVSGKTYNVSVIGSNDIHLEGAENIGGTVKQTFDIPVQFVNNPNVKYVAVHVTNPYAEALEEAFDAYQSMNKKLYEAIRQYENGEISLEEFNKVRLLSSEALSEYMRLGISYDEWEREHAAGTGTGNELGTVTIAEDGKTLTATYTVSSFSPFAVYAFTEAELPEIREFVTQPDGTLARAVNGQPVTTHTVASGENLTVIARKYGCTVDEIVALNSDLIENPSVISVGWVLTIPQK